MKKLLSLAIALMFSLSMVCLSLTGAVASVDEYGVHTQKDIDMMYAFVSINPATYQKGWARIDPNNPGALDTIAIEPTYNVFAAAYNATNGQVYGMYTDANWQQQFGTIDIENGIYTNIAPGFLCNGLAFDYTTGLFYAIQANTLVRINPATGDISAVGDLVYESGPPISICINADGELFITTPVCNLYSVDKATAEATLIGDTGLQDYSNRSMVYNYADDTYYIVSYTSVAPETNGLYSLDITTGAATFIGNYGTVRYNGLLSMYDEIQTPTPVPASVVTLNHTEYELVGGETLQLSATVMPLDEYVADRAVTWSSSDETLATVSARGLVTTAGCGGTVTITATSNSNPDVSASCVITMNDPYVVYRDISDALNVVEFGQPGYYLYTSVGAYAVEVISMDDRTVVRTTNAGQNGTISRVDLFGTVYLEAGSEISFDWKVSSLDNWHPASFYVNGGFIESIYGETDWATYTYAITESGEYTFAWDFNRGWGTGEAQDRLWLDNISITAVEIVQPGDVNGDGNVNVGDAAYLLRYTIDLVELDEEQLLIADVNEDGSVNTGDAAAILSLLMNAR